MVFRDLIKCPECGTVVDEDNILIERANIRTKKSYTDKGIVGCEDGMCPVIDIDSIPICEKNDVLFAKCYCDECNINFRTMIPIEVTAATSFSALDKSKLVMMT